MLDFAKVYGLYGLLAAVAIIVGAVYLWRKTPTQTSPTIQSSFNFGLLSLSGMSSLIVGALIDFALVLIVVSLINNALHVNLPILAKILFALMLGAVKYVWSINLGKNRVDLYKRGILEGLSGIIPSGPDGKGLLPGYYWFPLGWPFYSIAIEQTMKEISVPFENMQVWLKNSKKSGQGAIKGQVDGLAQFRVIDPAQYNSIEGLPESEVKQDPNGTPRLSGVLGILEAIVRQATRDVCEGETIDDFIRIANEIHAEKIFKKVREELLKRARSLGVELISITIKKTDNRSEAIEKGWEEIKKQSSLAVSRKTDAKGRVERIKTYKEAGVDANRAAVLDAVTDGMAGATVSDDRKFFDVGPGLGDAVKEVVGKFAGGKA